MIDPFVRYISSGSQSTVRITTRPRISFDNETFTLSDPKHDLTDALNESMKVIARLYFLFLVWTETEIGNLVFFQVVLEVIPSSMIVNFANDNAWAANNLDWVTWKNYKSLDQFSPKMCLFQTIAYIPSRSILQSPDHSPSVLLSPILRIGIWCSTQRASMSLT